MSDSTRNPDLHSLEDRIGVIFNKKHLLKTAITHDSYLNEPGGRGLESYERLEFLGNAS